ncbi:MAG TPA: hypothetical protein VKM72_23610 [Thermoanaerobaculia bacterium]|nr:hypothetical protein [Thermoanaerobaculia bacterium]
MMAEELAYKDDLGNLARQFEGRVRSLLVREISAWQNTQWPFLFGLISPEKQQRLDGIAERLKEAEGDALREAMQELRQALIAMVEEFAISAPEQAGEFRKFIEVIEALVRRVLDNEPPAERDILAELRSRNVPKFPADQRSIPRKDRIDPLEFLREHYGVFLVYFGASRNLISQADLQRWDPVLLVALTNRVNYLTRKHGHQMELREMIPRYSDLVSERLKEAPREKLLVNARLGEALRARERRARRADRGNDEFP